MSTGAYVRFAHTHVLIHVCVKQFWLNKLVWSAVAGRATRSQAYTYAHIYVHAFAAVLARHSTVNQFFVNRLPACCLCSSLLACLLLLPAVLCNGEAQRKSMTQPRAPRDIQLTPGPTF